MGRSSMPDSEVRVDVGAGVVLTGVTVVVLVGDILQLTTQQ